MFDIETHTIEEYEEVILVLKDLLKTNSAKAKELEIAIMCVEQRNLMENYCHA